jgi:hypothetical protein
MDFLEKFKVADYSGQPVSFIQRKFDGYYVEVYKSGVFGIVVCMKKQNIDLWPKLEKHPEIKQQLESLPNETILRCELHAFNVPATSVPTLINDADSRLMISPFKIELLDNASEDEYDIRVKIIETEILKDLGFVVPRSYVLFENPAPLIQSTINYWLETAKDCGYEGWVL